MLNITDDGIEQNRESSIGKFFRVLLFQFKHNCAETKHLYTVYGEFPGKKIVESHFPEYFERNIIATVFTGMIVESFLYDFACVMRSKSYAERVSKFSIEKEFISINKELLGRNDEAGNEVFKKLIKLNKIRKYYVHNKSAPVGIPTNKEIEHIVVAECLEILHSLFEYFVTFEKNYHASVIFLNFLKEIHKEERGYELGL